MCSLGCGVRGSVSTGFRRARFAFWFAMICILIGRHAGQKVESSCGYKPLLGSAKGGVKHVPLISPFDLRNEMMYPILPVIGCQSSNLWHHDMPVSWVFFSLATSIKCSKNAKLHQLGLKRNVFGVLTHSQMGGLTMINHQSSHMQTNPL